jgi:Ni,Fe-hydrogenase maturation factor
MRALVIAIGNPLRRDDGVAHRILKLLGDGPGAERRAVLQLTPEMAEEIASFDLVVFLDASVTATEPLLEPVRPSAGSPLTHVCSPGEIVALARSLFGFAGRAYLCHIPARDFSNSEKLSARAQRFADEAAGEIEHIIGA